jgi:hypothetical protein
MSEIIRLIRSTGRRCALIRSAAVAMVVSLRRGMVHEKPFPRHERPPKGARALGCHRRRVARRPMQTLQAHVRRTGWAGPALAGRS